MGDRVEVRDMAAWAAGVVDEVNVATGKPTVTKDGWDMGWEWAECRAIATATTSATTTTTKKKHIRKSGLATASDDDGGISDQQAF